MGRGRSRLCGGDADDGDAELIGEVEEFDLVDHDDIAGGEGEAAAAVLVHVLDGADADGWDIGPAVVPGACALAERPATRAAEDADAVDHAVGAFYGFDGDDVAVADGDRLADVEAESLGEEGPGEGDVGALVGGGLTAGHDAGFGEGVGDGCG